MEGLWFPFYGIYLINFGTTNSSESASATATEKAVRLAEEEQRLKSSHGKLNDEPKRFVTTLLVGLERKSESKSQHERKASSLPASTSPPTASRDPPTRISWTTRLLQKLTEEEEKKKTKKVIQVNTYFRVYLFRCLLVEINEFNFNQLSL